MRKIAAIVVAFALEAAAMQANAGNEEVHVGSTSIAFPGTPSLVRSEDHAVTEFANKELTSRKILLAVWIGPEERQGTQNFEPFHHRYAIAYVLDFAKDHNFSPAEFPRVKEVIRKDIADVEKGLSADQLRGLEDQKIQAIENSKHMDFVHELEFEAAGVHVLADNDRQLSDLIVQPVQSTRPEHPEAHTLLVCTNLLYLRGKVVTVNVFSERIDRTDSEWIEPACTKLVSAILASN